MKETNIELILPGQWASADGKLKKLTSMNIEYLKNCLKMLQVALERWEASNPDKPLFQMSTEPPHVSKPRIYELNFDQVQAKIEELKEVIRIKQN